MAKSKTMLRTFAALVWWVPSVPGAAAGGVAVQISMVFGLGVVIAVSVLAAAGVLSMVFPWRARRP